MFEIPEWIRYFVFDEHRHITHNRFLSVLSGFAFAALIHIFLPDLITPYEKQYGFLPCAGVIIVAMILITDILYCIVQVFIHEFFFPGEDGFVPLYLIVTEPVGIIPMIFDFLLSLFTGLKFGAITTLVAILVVEAVPAISRDIVDIIICGAGGLTTLISTIVILVKGRSGMDTMRNHFEDDVTYGSILTFLFRTILDIAESAAATVEGVGADIYTKTGHYKKKVRKEQEMKRQMAQEQAENANFFAQMEQQEQAYLQGEQERRYQEHTRLLLEKDREDREKQMEELRKQREKEKERIQKKIEAHRKKTGQQS